MRAYCSACGWSISTDDDLSQVEVSDRAIGHHVETGHVPIETEGGY